MATYFDKLVALNPLSARAQRDLTRVSQFRVAAPDEGLTQDFELRVHRHGRGLAVQHDAQRLVQVNKAAVQVEVERFHAARRNRRGVVADGDVDVLALVRLWHGQPEKVGDERVRWLPGQPSRRRVARERKHLLEHVAVGQIAVTESLLQLELHRVSPYCRP